MGDTQYPRGRFHAAIAAGKIGVPSLYPSLLRLLEDTGYEDPYLRHAAVMGLTGCASPSMLEPLNEHASSTVRIGAINALRRLRSAHVAAFLDDSDLVVREEAARAIHDDFSIPDALPALARKVESLGGLTDEAFVRRVLNANLRLGRKVHASRLYAYARDTNHPVAMRQEAIECLSVWNERPYLDRVEGRARNLGPRDPVVGNQLLQQLALERLASSSGGLKDALTSALKRNGLEVNPELLWEWLRDEAQSINLRINALELLLERVSKKERIEAIRMALASEQSALRVAALRHEAQSDPDSIVRRHRGMSQQTLEEQQTLIRLLAAVQLDEAEKLGLTYLRELKEGTLRDDWALDVIHLAKGKNHSTLHQTWLEYSGQEIQNDPLGEYRFSAFGGDVKRGQDVYQNHIAAQCVRCHNAGGAGKQVGPELAGIGKRVDRSYLLESILNPSAAIAPGFQTISVETNEGESYDGVIVSENSSTLVLGLAVGGTQTIEKSAIHSRRASQVSAMPSMRDVLTPDEVRDLLAYLAAL